MVLVSLGPTSPYPKIFKAIRGGFGADGIRVRRSARYDEQEHAAVRRSLGADGSARKAVVRNSPIMMHESVELCITHDHDINIKMNQNRHSLIGHSYPIQFFF